MSVDGGTMIWCPFQPSSDAAMRNEAASLMRKNGLGVGTRCKPTAARSNAPAQANPVDSGLRCIRVKNSCVSRPNLNANGGGAGAHNGAPQRAVSSLENRVFRGEE
eukprot:5216245-Prymnesium_polylepis.1